MIEIYNSKEWNALFGGSPNWIIADDGYIYEASEYYNLMPRPCGRIDMGRGEIYGKDYGSVNPRPIAYIRDKDGVKEIYKERPEASLGAVPFLYIENEKIYTREEYYKVFGGSASAYVKDDAKQKTKEEPQKQNTNGTVNSQKKTYNGGEIPISSGGGGGWGCFLFIVAFLALGKNFDEMVDIFSSPSRLLMFCSICIGLVLYGILLAKLFFGVASLIKGEGFMKGFNIKIIKELKEKFVWRTIPKVKSQNPNKKNIPENNGPTTYQHTCVKCGKKFSDQTAHNPYCEACRKKDEPPKTPVIYTHHCPVCGKAYTSAEKEPKDLRCESCKMAPEPNPQPTEEKKIFTCPKCGAKNRVPAGKGRIVITCGNRDCRNRFIVES